jgi:prepilin-type processing-associated H-X9-DG protein
MAGDPRTNPPYNGRYKGIFRYNSRTQLSDLVRGPENTVLYGEYWGSFVVWGGQGGIPDGWSNGSRSVGFNVSSFGTCPGPGPCDYQHSFGLSGATFGALHPGLTVEHPYTFNVAMADGSVRSLPGNINYPTWLTLCGIGSSGNPVGRLELEDPWAGIDY